MTYNKLMCIYFAFRTIVLFEVLLPKKKIPEKEFSNEIF